MVVVPCLVLGLGEIWRSCQGGKLYVLLVARGGCRIEKPCGRLPGQWDEEFYVFFLSSEAASLSEWVKLAQRLVVF